MIRKNTPVSLLLLSVILIITLGSCDPSKKYVKEENAKIQDYLNTNPTLAFELKPSGLYYLRIQEGTGSIPLQHDTAYVKYTGKFLNGTVFDTNVGETDSLIFPVGEGWMISGFDEGITLMHEGEKALFLMPSRLAYGSSGYYIIDGYTPLLYDVELVKVKPGSAK